MKQLIVLSAMAAGLGMLCAVPAVPQTAMEPRRIIKIIREEIKPGREAAHEAVETGYVRALSKTKYPNYMALTTLTGPSEAWFIEPYDSYAAVGDARELYLSSPAMKGEIERLDARDGELKTGGRVMLATYQKELSLHGELFRGQIPQMRFASVTTIRTRPGRAADYTRMRTLVVQAAAKASPDAVGVLYSVASGAPLGTYVYIRGLNSMKQLDPEPGQKAPMEFMSEENRREYLKLSSEVVLSIESMLFAINPAMSYTNKEITDAAPTFWKPKAAVAAAPKKAAGAQ